MFNIPAHEREIYFALGTLKIVRALVGLRSLDLFYRQESDLEAWQLLERNAEAIELAKRRIAYLVNVIDVAVEELSAKDLSRQLWTAEVDSLSDTHVIDLDELDDAIATHLTAGHMAPEHDQLGANYLRASVDNAKSQQHSANGAPQRGSRRLSLASSSDPHKPPAA
jgi:hypothetical protein